jgi:hypothetical protein
MASNLSHELKFWRDPDRSAAALDEAVMEPANPWI